MEMCIVFHDRHLFKRSLSMKKMFFFTYYYQRVCQPSLKRTQFEFVFPSHFKSFLSLATLSSHTDFLCAFLFLPLLFLLLPLPLFSIPYHQFELRGFFSRKQMIKVKHRAGRKSLLLLTYWMTLANLFKLSQWTFQMRTNGKETYAPLTVAKTFKHLGPRYFTKIFPFILLLSILQIVTVKLVILLLPGKLF